MPMDLPFRFTPFEGFGESWPAKGRTILTSDKCGFFCCTQGWAEIDYAGRTLRLGPSDIFMYIPSMMVRPADASADVCGVVGEVHMDYILPIVLRVAPVDTLLGIRVQPVATLSAQSLVFLQRTIADVCSRVTALETESGDGAEGVPHRLAVELLKSMGQTVCYEVLNAYFRHRHWRAAAPGGGDAVFQSFVLALFRNFRYEREVAYYAGLQHLSPRYFSHVVKERSGFSPLQWIVQMVITEARQLLEVSDMSIKQISVHLNFPTQSFFGKYFKQYVGVSPKVYRQRSLHPEG